MIHEHSFVGIILGGCNNCNVRIRPSHDDTLGLGQRAALAAVEMLRFLREKSFDNTERINMTTIGAHGANADLCIATPLEARVTFAAMLGIAKCLPYELPSLLYTPNDMDPYARKVVSKEHNNETANFQVDVYGVGSQCNTTRVPLMCYPGSWEQPNSFMRHAMSATCVITGQ